MARLRSTKQQRRSVMTLDEVRAVMAAAASIDPAAALMLRVAAVSGARRAELAALRWDDLRDGLLTIDSAIEIVSSGDGVREFRDAATKTANTRVVTLDSDTVAAIEALRHEWEPYGPWMFGLRPDLVSPDRIGWWWKRARKLAGIDESWRLHDLRHWSVTAAIGQGHDVRTVAGRLGHANPAMTLRVYAHAFAAADQAVATGLGELLKRVIARSRGVRPIVVRDEEPPDDTVVVVRGGEMNGDIVRRTASDAFDEFGIYTVSVFLALGATVDELCRDRPELQRYGRVRLTTVGRLRSLGFALVPTLDRPHYDVVLPDLADATLDRLELGFDQPIPNPARRV